MLDDALALEAAGADLVLLECIPATLGQTITEALQVPVIGIGAGADTDGQILVLYDILDITQGRKPRFVRNFVTAVPRLRRRSRNYVQAVKSRRVSERRVHAFDRKTMETLATIAAVRARVRAWRHRGSRVALRAYDGQPARRSSEPARGGAHARAQRVVASMFVNPMQFGPSEDYARYPRTPARGRAAAGRGRLRSVVCTRGVGDLSRSVASRRRACTCVACPRCSKARFRPGHFDGVAPWWRSCSRIVLPDVAVFGEKDYQQLLIIRRMVLDLALPLEVIGAPTVRAPDGLALSSRNTLSQRSRSARARQRSTVRCRLRCRRSVPVSAISPRSSATASRRSSGQGCGSTISRSGKPRISLRRPPARS